MPGISSLENAFRVVVFTFPAELTSLTMFPPGEAIRQSLPWVEQKRDLLPAILEVEKCLRVLCPGEGSVDR